MTSTLLGTALPLAAAPMAGGPTTVRLTDAVTRAGAFAFLAGGYQAPEVLAEEIGQVRAQGRPFGVNLFAPGSQQVDAAAFARYAVDLASEAAAYGLSLDQTPHTDDDRWAEKLELLRHHPVPVVSFTFALPTRAEIAGLRGAGSVVLASVTTADEARAAEESGVDGVVVQGPSAGGHSATWDPGRVIDEALTTEVVASVRRAIGLPIIAAGGVDGPEAVRDLLSAGAESVAVGTLLLRSDEAATNTPHRDALASPGYTETAVTRVFTGRPARALRNGFVVRHEAHAVNAYPAVHHLTRELRRLAVTAGDTDRIHLWAGTGYRSASTGPATKIIQHLSADL